MLFRVCSQVNPSVPAIPLPKSGSFIFHAYHKACGGSGVLRVRPETGYGEAMGRRRCSLPDGRVQGWNNRGARWFGRHQTGLERVTPRRESGKPPEPDHYLVPVPRVTLFEKAAEGRI